MNIIDENNKSNMITQGTTTAVFSTYFHTAYIAMIPWFVAAIPLIIIDLKYGREKARRRYEKTKNPDDKVTLNKSVRMTIDKSFSYICWIMLSTTLSMAFDCNYIKYGIMGIIYGLEVISIIRSYLQLKGYEVNEIAMLRLLIKLIWNKITGTQEDFKDIITKK